MTEHTFSYCELCERHVVICGKCGNNTCNGGKGQVDGEPCDACASAYELDTQQFLTDPALDEEH